jgi:threonine synthase
VSKVIKLKCVKCGREYDEDEAQYVCPECGIDGILDVILDYDSIGKALNKDYLKLNKNYSLFRYLPAIPIENTRGIQPLKAGWTPLYKAAKLSEKYSLPWLYIKDDGLNPTGSLKDRGKCCRRCKSH